MKLTKSHLRKIINEELEHLLSEFEDDDEHDDGEEGRGEDPERDAYWDKVVADRTAEYKRNPPELGMKGALARRAKHRAGRNPNPPRPKFMREDDDEPYEEGLRRRRKPQKRKRK